MWLASKPGVQESGGAGAPSTDYLHMCLLPHYFLILLCHVTLVFGLDSILIMIVIMLKALMPNMYILDWLISCNKAAF